MRGGDPIGWVVAIAGLAAIFAVKFVGELAYIRYAQTAWFKASTRSPIAVAIARSVAGALATTFGLLPFTLIESEDYTMPGAIRIAVPLLAQLVMRIVIWAAIGRWAYGRSPALGKFVIGGLVVSYLLDVPAYFFSVFVALGTIVGAHISSC